MTKPRFIYNTGKTIEEPESVRNAWVELLFRDGTVEIEKANKVYWMLDGDFCDIIAYRVIKKGDK